ncbi:DUF6319 family protein [Speluncibacter jeojiensis]|uniref:DUF6319 family protein n=1 Tax=Speluncibacter jeojiensis TaxID=2710754 RepID=A0A9X4M4R3_9ACTN|nr:DUF6319 family protein [Corynebacteriales bacterium D3-21]
MPPRSRTDSLTPENLVELTEAVAEGRRVTVYFREATPSLNLEAGSSARVVSVSGTTVMLRPKGVNDELPFEADELRMTKTGPAAATPKRRPAVKPAQNEPGKAPVAVKPTAAVPVKPQATPATPPAESVKEPVVASQPQAKAAQPPAQAPAPKTAPAARKRTSKKAPTSVSVTIYGSADNEWTVAVTHGARRPGKSAPVTPDAVERAVRELGQPAALEAVDSLLGAAREEAERRVAELSRQLEEARDALAALGVEE